MERTWRWAITIAAVGTLAAGNASALDCDQRLARATARFDRLAARAIDACGARSGAGCPDARLGARLRTLRRHIETPLQRRCPGVDASAAGDGAGRLLCARLGVCAPKAMTLRVVASGPTAADAASLGAAVDAAPAHLRVDAGFTGFAHDLQIMEGAGFAATLADCDGVTTTACLLHAATAGTAFGAPSPISAGGVGTCVTVDYASDLVGTMDLASGDLDVSAEMRIGVYTGALEAPCPVCVVADGEPQLGEAGTCRGGPHAGAACTVEGLAAPYYGVNRATSGQCGPEPATEVAEFVLDVGATTGGVTRASGVACQDSRFGRSCWCADEPLPNACGDGICTPTADGGMCENGPFERFCATEPFRACTADDDCRGGDTCGSPMARPCFPDPIILAGTPNAPVHDVARPVLTGAFCMPRARSGAVNAAAGFPGPTTFVWPTQVLLEH